MSQDFLVFDLETGLVPGALDLDRFIPGITVAATYTGSGELRHWFEPNAQGRPVGGVMSPATAQGLVQYLADRAGRGDVLVTWNGASFDWRVLANASGLTQPCIDLAWQHIDLMFWFHCKKGFSISLSKAAEAVGTSKTEGLSGADAPQLWAEGRFDTVLDYVAQDVRVTAAVYQAALRNNGISWRTAAGRPSKAAGRPVSVRQACQLPLPDTSWMNQPWPRDRFVGWMRH